MAKDPVQSLIEIYQLSARMDKEQKRLDHSVRMAKLTNQSNEVFVKLKEWQDSIDYTRGMIEEALVYIPSLN